MKIGIYTDRIEESWTYGMSGEIFFSPLLEMFAAMHVICNPEHHTGRAEWCERVKRLVDKELLDEIRALSECTREWLAPPDFLLFDDRADIRNMDIEEALFTLDGYNIRRWKRIFELNERDVTLSQKKRIIEVSRRFYEEYFRNEAVIIEPLMIAALRKVLKRGKKKEWQRSFHPYMTGLNYRIGKLFFIKTESFIMPMTILIKSI